MIFVFIIEILAIIITFLPATLGLRCYSCDSMFNPNCVRVNDATPVCFLRPEAQSCVTLQYFRIINGTIIRWVKRQCEMDLFMTVKHNCKSTMNDKKMIACLVCDTSLCNRDALIETRSNVSNKLYLSYNLFAILIIYCV